MRENGKEAWYERGDKNDKVRTIGAFRIDLADFFNAIHNFELALRVGSAIFEFSHHVALLLFLFAIVLGLHNSMRQQRKQ